jgi:tetratricopeptide (TPR) repeat protein
MRVGLLYCAEQELDLFNRRAQPVTKTKAIALFVAVVGSLLYFKTVFFPPAKSWEYFNKAGLAAYGKKDYAEAEKQLTTALREAEKFALDDPRFALSLNNLAEIYRVQARHAEAEFYLKRSLENAENVYGPEHPNVAANLNNLAGNYRIRGMYAEAEPFAKRALDIWQKTLGPENSLVLFALEGYVDLLKKMGRNAEAKSYEAQMKIGLESNASGNQEN